MNPDQYVLLVEDDIDISEAVESILQEEGYKIQCAFNGKEALEYLRTAKSNPELILLDIMMPYMNGYEFRECQLKDPKISSIPTIILSAAGKHEDIDKLHFKETLKKPLDLDTLIDVVRRNVPQR
jgi:two-component system alkaline phosphatase synthesis response regulator PhoP